MNQGPNEILFEKLFRENFERDIDKLDRKVCEEQGYMMAIADLLNWYVPKDDPSRELYAKVGCEYIIEIANKK